MVSLFSAYYNIIQNNTIIKPPNHQIVRIPLSLTKYNANVAFVRTLFRSVCYGTASLWLLIVLILSGDVHPNPGPEYNSLASNCHQEQLSNFSIVHYNIQSIFNKLDNIYVELRDFDVLTFSETWLSDSVHTDDLRLPTYHCPERKDRVQNRYGGVCAYVKSNYKYKRRHDLEPDGLECIWLELKIKTTNVLIGIFYRPPGSCPQVFEIIESSFNLALDTGINDIIITGDFNFDTNKPASSRFVSSLCQQFGLTQIINEPTHFTENSSSVIDIMFLRNPNTLLSSGVSDPFLNQNQRYHCPIFGVFKFEKIKSKSFKRRLWKYQNGDYNLMKIKSRSINWLENEDSHINDFNVNVIEKLKKTN